MAVVSMIKEFLTVTFVTVHGDSMEINVNSIFDHVKWTLAGIMVCPSDFDQFERISLFISGTCSNRSMNEFSCLCRDGWTGLRCETMVNYCQNIICQNQGVCQPLFRDYHCACSSSSYSGRHCEIEASSLVARKVASKSLAFIAIICVCIVIGFVVVLDGLKYIFHIDPTRRLREQLRQQRTVQKKSKKKKPPVIVRHKYIDHPPKIPTVEETV